jgi:hypothetical protein
VVLVASGCFRLLRWQAWGSNCFGAVIFAFYSLFLHTHKQTKNELNTYAKLVSIGCAGIDVVLFLCEKFKPGYHEFYFIAKAVKDVIILVVAIYQKPQEINIQVNRDNENDPLLHS